MNDQDYVRLAAHGRQQAVVDLYRKYLVAVYRFFYWQTNRTQEVAEDMTSQTFLEMVRGIANFEGKNFRNYLYGIAKKQLMDWTGKNYKEPTLPLFESLGMGEEMLDEEVMNQKITAFEKLMDKLPEHEQTVVKMRYMTQATSREIADKLKVSEGEAKVMVHRVIRKLARQSK